MEEKAKEPEKSKERVLDPSAVMNLAAYPISIGAGVYSAKQHIRNASVEYQTKLGNFDKETAEMVHKAGEARKNGGKPFGNNMQEAIAKIREEYEDAKSLRFKNMGYKNIKHNWGDIADNTKTEAIVAGMTVFGVALGALLIIANSKEAFKPLFKDKNKEQGAAK